MFGATIATALLVSDLIALLLTRRPLKLAAPTQLSIARHDLYLSHHALGLRPDEIDRKQPLRELGAQHLHPVCKKKATLELPGGDAAMQIFTRLVLLLPPSDRELVLFDRDFELVLREAGDRERDAQLRRLGAIGRVPLDIVGRIAVRPRLRDLV